MSALTKLDEIIQYMQENADGLGVPIAIAAALVAMYDRFIGRKQAEAREKERFRKAEDRENERARQEKENYLLVHKAVTDVKNIQSVNDSFIRFFEGVSEDLKEKIQQLTYLIRRIEALIENLSEEISKEKNHPKSFLLRHSALKKK